MISLLPYWLWVFIIITFITFISVVISALIGLENDEDGCTPIIWLLLIVFSLFWFEEVYEDSERDFLLADARKHEFKQYKIWARDSISFLSETLSARKAMEKKVKEDTQSYSPVVAETIDLLENRIKDYQFRTFALKDALIDSNVRRGITSKSQAENTRKEYGIILHRSTGISEINPDDMSIKSIVKYSPAYEAGLAEGDIITNIVRHDSNDWKTMEQSDINSLTGNYVYRGRMTLRIKPKQGIRPVGKIGVAWSGEIYEGMPAMKIGEILINRPAELAGLRVDDKIIKINDSPQLTHSDFYYHFLNLDTIESTKLGIVRDGLEMDIIVMNDLIRGREFDVFLPVRDIPIMIDDTYSEWVKLTEALKISLEMMRFEQRKLYTIRRENELNPTNQDKSEEINKLILEAKKTADRNIQIFELGESNE